VTDRAITPGSGTPFTSSGRSIGYRPPPWRMRGRAIALWYRLADPDEARRHVPPWVNMDDDPIVRARFWDLEHDAAGPQRPDDVPPRWTAIREAVVAFPVRHGAVSGDLPTYMLADDPVYIAMGRELMGWPVRGGIITFEGAPGSVADPGTPAAGTHVTASLVRDGQEVMRAAVTLTGTMERDHRPTPPRWLAEKVIGHVDRPGAAIAQLVATGPEWIERRDRWAANGSLSFGESPADELGVLGPREIVAAELWTDLDLAIGWGEVLAELGDGVYGTG
jgi:acetoacetate decarboxylase